MSTDSKAPEQTALTDNPTPEKKELEDGGTSGEKELKSGGTTKKTTFKDDPSRTAGIPNWGWLLLFMVLAATPVAVVVKSWVAPPATTQQTQLERPAPPQSQSTADKTPTGTEQRLSALEAKLDELKDTEKRLSVLEARLDDTYSTVEAVGFSAGLFGVLITVITIFFALKESERVKDAMNRIEEIEDKFKTAEDTRRTDELNRKSEMDETSRKAKEIQERAETAKDDVIFALSQARIAKETAREAVLQADSAQKKVLTVYDQATKTSELAANANEEAKAAKDTAVLAVQLSKQLQDLSNKSGNTVEGSAEKNEQQGIKDQHKMELIAKAKTIANKSGIKHLIEAVNELSTESLDDELGRKLRSIVNHEELADALGIQLG